MMAEAVLADLPGVGMTTVQPSDCVELLKLCTVMNWRPRLPLSIMRDESAGRWFLRGMPGETDYWMRDADIAVLRSTPMWGSVVKAKPYGYIEPLIPAPPPPDALADIFRAAKEAVERDTIFPYPVDYTSGPRTAEEVQRQQLSSYAKLKDIIDSGVLALPKAEIYKAILSGSPIPAAPDPSPYAGRTADYIVMDDLGNGFHDPVTAERHRLARERLAAEERIRKMDEWDE